jgi:hypothetical protein
VWVNSTSCFVTVATGAGQVLIYSNLNCSAQPTVIESVEPILINATDVPFGECVRNTNTTSSYIDVLDDQYDDYYSYSSSSYSYYSYNYYYDDSNGGSPSSNYTNTTAYANTSSFFSFDLYPFMMLQCTEDIGIPVTTASTVLR